MDQLTPETLNQLLEFQNGMAVSIYMPAERRGPETRQNPIRFKNMVKRAESLWAEAAGDPTPNDVFDPARRLVEDHVFWQNQSSGLAAFLSKNGMKSYRLPISFEELAIVADRFHVKPLIGFVAEDRRFFVLALSGKNTRLVRCTRQTAQEIEPEEMPASLQEALAFDLPQKQLQFHTGTAEGGERRAAVYHGQGGGESDKAEVMTRFCQAIRAGVNEILGDGNAPLVLAGAEPLVSMFREVNTYPRLAVQHVPGNPDERSPEALRDAAWEALIPQIERERTEAVDRFMDATNGDRACRDLRRILPAALHGRVDTLLIAEGVRQFGRYDPDTDTLNLSGNPKPGEGDLLDLVAGQTLLKGGSVFPLPPAQVPGEAPVAALMRY
ncbi:MAG: hypothetical protein ACOC98_11825, partial [Thermodesulfobacteriota bacterium]